MMVECFFILYLILTFTIKILQELYWILGFVSLLLKGCVFVAAEVHNISKAKFYFIIIFIGDTNVFLKNQP